MKVLVIHDRAGKIEGLAVPGPEVADQIQMVPRKGRLVTQVNIEDLKGDVLSSENQERLLGIIKAFRLKAGPGGALLVRAAEGKRKSARSRSQS
jgi:hypothetical protein